MKRILEISRFGFLKELCPERTDWVRLGAALTWEPETTAPERPGLFFWAKALMKIRRGCYSHLILPAIDVSYGYDASKLKRFVRKNFFTGNQRLLRFLSALTIPSRTKIIILDFSDYQDLSVPTCTLFSRFDYTYFKRELDLNWNQNPQLTKFIKPGRLRDTSLFLPAIPPISCDEEKENDLFFAAAACSEERHHAIQVVSELQKRGVKVDFPTGPLEYHDYLKRMSKAWLTLSPEGYGWDCYRHYEACACGSVPVINRPKFSRKLYLKEKTHCFYYQPGDPNLGDLMQEWLSDKTILRRMAEDGHRHVRDCCTKRAIAQRLIACAS